MFIFGINEASHLEKKADYDKLVKEFGAEFITGEIIQKFSKPHRLLRLKFFFAHRDFETFLSHHEVGHQVSIVSGRGPSNYMHLGHLLLFDFVRWLQEELNAEIYIPLSDDEKYVFGKVKSLKRAYLFAIDNALDILALGFKEGKTFLFISSKLQKVYELSIALSRYLTCSTIKATFGLSDSTNAGTIFYAAVQAAHILMPTLEKELPVLVPVAIDQDPYIRLTRDLAERLHIKKPASIYSRYLRGLTGEPMSASKPETCIFTRDPPEVVRRKVWSALTGGRATIREQQKLGGEPDRCIVFEWLCTYIFDNEAETSRHYEKCKSGELLCGECKKMLANELIKFLERHHKKRKEMIDKIDKFFIHEVMIPDEIPIK